MNARIPIACPTCGEQFGLRYNPTSPEAHYPTMAREQLEKECPDHYGKTWDIDKWGEVPYGDRAASQDVG